MRKIWDKIVEWIQRIPSDKDLWTTNKWEWWDFSATCFGCLLAQGFVLLNMWWF